MMENPFRLLDYYRYEDAPLFFGREEETAKMVGEILSTRLLVLFSPSGSGKTSLINAGVRPELERMGYRTVYTRMEEEPATEVCNAATAVLNLEKAVPAQGLHEFLKQAVQDTGQPLVIFLDQFEEFFIVFKDNDTLRREFIAEVAKIKYDEQLPVFLVFSLREDYFANLHEFRAAIPSIFQNNANIRLGPFTDKTGRRVMEEPLKQVGWKLAEGLADRVVADLNRFKKGGAGIEPMSLQMVCGALWQGRKLGQEKVIGPGVYEACGGAEKVLTRYVNDRLTKVPRGKQGLMVKVFEALKTPDNTKRFRSREDLQTQFGIKNPRRFSDFLGVLAKEGILRKEEKEGTCWYEFIHDLLVPEINGWITARKERRSRRRFIYADLPGIILFSILAVYFFIQYHTFYAVLSGRQYSNQEEEIAIIRGFNPFKERIETGFFKSDIKEDVATQNKLNPRFRVGFWNRNDWTGLGEILKVDRYAILITRLGQEERAVKFCINGLKDNSHIGWVATAEDLMLRMNKIKYNQFVFEALLFTLSDSDFDFQSVVAQTPRILEKSDKGLYADDAVVASLKKWASDIRSKNVFLLAKIGKSYGRLIDELELLLEKDEDWSVRAVTAFMLGKIRISNDRLIRKLESVLVNDRDHWAVRSLAALALGKLGKSDNVVIDGLLKALNKKGEDLRVRAVAAFALGKLGKSDKRVIDGLLKALKDEDCQIHAFAAFAVGKLGKSDDRLVYELKSIIKKDKEEWLSRAFAAFALGKLGKSSDKGVIDGLLKALEDQDSRVRAQTAFALVNLDKSSDTRVIDGLLNALKDTNSDVQNQAASKLEMVGKSEKRVINGLVMMLKKDPNSDARTQAAYVLGKIGKSDNEVIDGLVEALKDMNSDTRAQAAFALGKIGKSGNRVIDGLLTVLEDQDWRVRFQAVKAMIDIKILFQSNKGIITILLRALTDNYADVRLNAAKLIKKIVDYDKDSEMRVIEELESVRKSEDWRVRVPAVFALAKIGKLDKRVIEELASALEADDWRVRAFSAFALGDIGSPNKNVIDGLLERLKDPNSDVRTLSAEALGKLDTPNKEVIDGLLGALTDTSTDVCSQAALALGKLGKPDKNVTDGLLGALENSSSYVRTQVALALEKLDKPDKNVIDGLVAALKDMDLGVRLNSAEALGKLLKTKSETEILKMLKHPFSGYRNAAAFALAQKGSLSEEILEKIKKFGTKDSRPWVRLSAWKALELLEKKKENEQKNKRSN